MGMNASAFRQFKTQALLRFAHVSISNKFLLCCAGWSREVTKAQEQDANSASGASIVFPAHLTTRENNQIILQQKIFAANFFYINP